MPKTHPNIKPTVGVSRIPARKLCPGQRRPSFAGLDCARRRIAPQLALVMYRGSRVLQRARRIAEGVLAMRAIDSSRPMERSDPDRVRNIMTNVYMHLDMLLHGRVPASDHESHDYLCHIVGIAQIRTIDIGIANRANGGIQTANEVMLSLNADANGLARARERWEKSGRWGLDGPAIEALRDAASIYEEVLRASSPLQMEQAQTVRLARLKAQMGVAA